jgi:hypothetical protein
VLNFFKPSLISLLGRRKKSNMFANGNSQKVDKIEWFKVAILEGFFPSLVQPQTKSIGICIERVQAMKKE